MNLSNPTKNMTWHLCDILPHGCWCEYNVVAVQLCHHPCLVSTLPSVSSPRPSYWPETLYLPLYLPNVHSLSHLVISSFEIITSLTYHNYLDAFIVAVIVVNVFVQDCCALEHALLVAYDDSFMHYVRLAALRSIEEPWSANGRLIWGDYS